MDKREIIRKHVTELLARKGDHRPFGDDDRLLVTARLDSIDVVETVAFLEDTFAVDFGARDFDQGVFESVSSLVAFVDESAPR